MRVNDISFFNGKEIVLSDGNGFEKPLDGSKLYNVKPLFYAIDFTSANQPGMVVWNNDHTEATFTHTMNCQPIVTVYDSNGELSHPIVTVLTGNSFTLSFGIADAVGEEPWHCVVNYGCPYQEGDESFSSQVTSIMSDLQAYMELATEVNNAIQEFNADNEEY